MRIVADDKRKTVLGQRYNKYTIIGGEVINEMGCRRVKRRWRFIGGAVVGEDSTEQRVMRNGWR